MTEPPIGICDWLLIVDQTTGLLTLQVSQWELLAERNPTLIYFFFLPAMLHFVHLYILAEIQYILYNLNFDHKQYLDLKVGI